MSMRLFAFVLLSGLLSNPAAYSEVVQQSEVPAEGLLCERHMVRRVFGPAEVQWNSETLLRKIDRLGGSLPSSKEYDDIRKRLSLLAKIHMSGRLMLIQQEGKEGASSPVIGELIDIHYNRSNRNEPYEVLSELDLPWPEILVYTRSGTQRFSLPMISLKASLYEWNSRTFDQESGTNGSLSPDLWAHLLTMNWGTLHYNRLKTLKDSLSSGGWLELTEAGGQGSLPIDSSFQSEPIRFRVQRVLRFEGDTFLTQVIDDRGQIQLLDLAFLLENYSWASGGNRGRDLARSLDLSDILEVGISTER